MLFAFEVILLVTLSYVFPPKLLILTPQNIFKIIISNTRSLSSLISLAEKNPVQWNTVLLIKDDLHCQEKKGLDPITFLWHLPWKTTLKYKSCRWHFPKTWLNIHELFSAHIILPPIQIEIIPVAIKELVFFIWKFPGLLCITYFQVCYNEYHCRIKLICNVW